MFSKAYHLLKYCLIPTVGGGWMAPLALAFFVMSYVWRNYFGGLHDAILFQVLGLVALWYICVFGVMKTLGELRLNTNSFLIDDVKRISYWVGLISCLFILICSFLFLKQFSYLACIVVLVVFQLALIFSQRLVRWTDLVRLNMVALTPFFLIGMYVMSTNFFPVSTFWLSLIVGITAVLLAVVFYSHYKNWVSGSKNVRFDNADWGAVSGSVKGKRGVNR
jgi:hypothetical protein